VTPTDPPTSELGRAEPQRSSVASLLIAAVLLLLLAALLAVYLAAAMPARLHDSTPARTDHDPAAIDAAMDHRAVQQPLERIHAQGSRFAGQPGFEQTRALIRETYRDAGLHVFGQRIDTVTVQSETRRITTPGGQALADPSDDSGRVQVYPLFPNHVQPVVTPEGGLVGQLRRVDDELVKDRRSFDEIIAVVDADNPPQRLGLDWSRYAQLGFAGLIVADRRGIGDIGWTPDQVARLFDNAPVNYPRLVATPGIFNHLGETVRIDVRGRFVNLPNENVMGLLTAAGDAQAPPPDGRSDGPEGLPPAGAQELMVVLSPYDAPSYLPDLARGGVQAVALATHLSLAQGLSAYRSALGRDVLFVATGGHMMGQSGTYRLLEAAGYWSRRSDARARLQSEHASQQQQRDTLRTLVDLYESDAFLRDPQATEAALDTLARPARRLIREQFRYLLSALTLELSEPMLRYELAFIREGEDPESEAYFAFREAKLDHDRVAAVSGYPIVKFVREAMAEPDSVGQQHRVRRRLEQRLEQLLDHHERELALAQDALRLNALFRRYRSVVVVCPRPVPAERPGSVQGVSYAIAGGNSQHAGNLGPVVSGRLSAVWQQQGGDATGVNLTGQQPNHVRFARQQLAERQQLDKPWNDSGYPALSLISVGRAAAYRRSAHPTLEPWMTDLSSLSGTLPLIGRACLDLALGSGQFPAVRGGNPISYHGQVLVAEVGRSIVPNFPLDGALVAQKQHPNQPWVADGAVRQVMQFTDPYGRYALMGSAAKPHSALGGYSPGAYGYNPRGEITLIKDEGLSGQGMFQSMGLSTRQGLGAVQIIVFRASPVTLLDRINPQTLRPFTAMQLIARAGLDGFDSVNRYDLTEGGFFQHFIRPTERFYVLLQAGDPDNELVQRTRAFMLGIEPGQRPEEDRAIAGPGYLAADVDVLTDAPTDIAASMLWTNGVRLDLQRRYAMADDRLIQFHQRADELLRESQQPDRPRLEQTRLARDAVTYTALNHPVLRDKISEAVLSIMWYLCLLVPFAFFFEKLVFGYADIRKQLVAQALIFLLVFFLLRLLHPAFEMIRSSIMILLGFVIMLISLGMSALFAGKFRETVDALQQHRGQISGAEANTFGVMGTAFMLGLNNMHRRKVRTGLTCATLVLMTFAMISFTSTTSDIVDEQVALGKAGYEGILIKDPELMTISEGQRFALSTKYGDRFRLARRAMLVGSYEAHRREVHAPELAVTRADAPEHGRGLIRSVLLFSQQEPLADRITFLTRRGWFDPMPPAELKAQPVKPVIIPDTLAERLNIEPQRVDRERVDVVIGGQRFVVHSIFDSDTLGGLTDLDGVSLLPFDIEAMRDFKLVDGQVVAEPPYVEVPAQEVVLMRDPGALQLPFGAGFRTTSVAVWLRDAETGAPLPFRDARETIESFLEQSGQAMYYGLDGIAYRGQRARQTSIAGLVDIIIPLIIAAMAVLNTMKGSVYERRDEIYVYNAVGIAPRYIFTMFFAEAFVYAVVGSVLGYILSQGVGRLLTELGLTYGLNMTFASLDTIYASLAIVAAVFISTLFPALSAMRIAAPADEAGWDIPEPVGDVMTITLPFTFDPRDRIAVIEFFRRYLEDHGEGSSGRFFAGPPGLNLIERDPVQVTTAPDLAAPGAAPGPAAAPGGGQPDPLVPALEATVWLKPFDLGVSQTLRLSLPVDANTSEPVAQLELIRLSGTSKAWVSLNKPFLLGLRRKFLHWRAVSHEQRSGMFEQARDRFRAVLEQRGALSTTGGGVG